MRVKLFTTLLIASLSACGFAPVDAFTVNLRDAGIRQYNARQYSQAVDTLTRAAAMYKGDGLSHYYLANSLLKIGQTNKAIIEYKKAYYLSDSEQMAKQCARALEAFNIRLPVLPPEQWKIRSARANLTPVTSAPVNQISRLAEHRLGEENLESHPSGLEKFTTAPEGGALAGKWDQWIENFRIAFNTVLFKKMGRKSSALWGNTRMVFSIDSSRRLRGKILESNSPFFFRYYLLDTTRFMDGTDGLQFPSGSTIPGYNFTMGWSQGQPRRVDTQTLAELKQLAYQLHRNPISGQRLTAGRLAGTMSSKDVSANLRTTGVNGALAKPTGLQTTAKMGSLPLPSFSTSVSGLVVPKEKGTETNTEVSTISVGVHGELSPNTDAATGVSGSETKSTASDSPGAASVDPTSSSAVGNASKLPDETISTKVSGESNKESKNENNRVNTNQPKNSPEKEQTSLPEGARKRAAITE